MSSEQEAISPPQNEIALSWSVFAAYTRILRLAIWFVYDGGGGGGGMGGGYWRRDQALARPRPLICLPIPPPSLSTPGMIYSALFTVCRGNPE
jgi:hypothetical protein